MVPSSKRIAVPKKTLVSSPPVTTPMGIGNNQTQTVPKKRSMSVLFHSSSPSRLPDSNVKTSPLVTTPPHRGGVGASKRLCLIDSREKDSLHESPDCCVTHVETSSSKIEINPPDKEWKAIAIEYLLKWSRSKKIDTTAEESDLNYEKSQSVEPHAVDTIMGDGHCLFRAISKAITGNQKKS